MKHAQALVVIATDQHGLLTRAQARAAGVPASTMGRYIARGFLEPEAHAVYRLVAAPTDRFTPYQRAVLRAGPRACISHASVLEMLQLCDVLLPHTHVTVPRESRIRLGADPSYRVHRIDLPAEEVLVHEGIPLMAPRRAIREAIRGGEDPEQVALAIRSGAREGWLTRGERASLTRLNRTRRTRPRPAPTGPLPEPVTQPGDHVLAQR